MGLAKISQKQRVWVPNLKIFFQKSESRNLYYALLSLQSEKPKSPKAKKPKSQKAEKPKSWKAKKPKSQKAEKPKSRKASIAMEIIKM